MQAHVSSPLNDALSRIAQQNGFTAEAAGAMLDALVRGGGGMAQFTHPEFGGSGQWMRGGMTMVPDMSNHALTARVDALGRDISDWLASQQQGRVDLTTLPVAPVPAPVPERTSATVGHDDIIATIEKLATLHERGILSAEEFAAKKSELLDRI